MRKLSLLLILVLMILGFQNFKFFGSNLQNYQVNEKARIGHAKELLGKKYKKSAAAKFEKQTLINTQILTVVQNNLPEKYQSKSEKITKAILSESNRYNIDPVFILSVIKTESAFNPAAIGTSGEIGLMQLMPNTAKYIANKIDMKYYGAKTLRDPVKNIRLGAAYLNYLREKFDNKADHYLPAYNSGPTKITKVENQKDLPKIYSDKVLKHYETFYKRFYAVQMHKTQQRFAANN